jgi:hypothetical protein
VKTYRNQRGACPHCGATQDAATTFEKAKQPKPGDVGICIMCAGVSVFEFGGERRLPNNDEQREFAADDEIQRSIALLRAAKVGGP